MLADINVIEKLRFLENKLGLGVLGAEVSVSLDRGIQCFLLPDFRLMGIQ